MQITFYGAAREVTGSCNMVEAGGHKLLVDCGMFQGSDFNEGKNSEPLPFDPKQISAVVVTHAHLDHVGRLPILVKDGYAGHFYATPATIELTGLILEDALAVMLYDHRKFGRPVLYDASDISGVMQMFKPVDYGHNFILPLVYKNKKEEITIKLRDAGHIFGSAFVELRAEGKKVVFSGDVGNINVPILRETELLPPDLDAVICESTYGDRIHEGTDRRLQIIEDVITESIARGGVLMIPSFSLERTQELLYDLNDLIDRKHRLPRIPIFLDSPLAIGATKVYRQYTEYYNEEAARLLKQGDDIFNFSGLTMTETSEESKRINQTPGPKIIIAGAGMMNGGRIVHHAVRYLSDSRSTLLIIGYQAHGTLGRRILEGESPVKVMGETVPVHCRVKAVGAFSAHADQEKLLNWLGGGGGLPKKVYLNHGEPPASEALHKRLTEDFGLKSTVVNFGLTVKV